MSHARMKCCAILGAAAGLALVSGAPAADAAFSLAACKGQSILGRGSSFQNTAQGATVWNGSNGFKSTTVGCGTAAITISFQPDGSGAGRRAMGERSGTNTTGERDPGVRFGAADEAPTDAQRAQIEAGPVDANGQDVTAADNNKLHVIPVTNGAIAVVVNWPRANDDATNLIPSLCDYAGLGDAAFGGRPKLKAATIEKLFAGTITTWGAAVTDSGGTGFTGVNATNCAAVPVKRAVRADDSGSTNALKQWLQRINSSTGWSGTQNSQWPNNTGANAVYRPVNTGGGALRDVIDGNNGHYKQDPSGADTTSTGQGISGSIGYLDLATARNQTAVASAADTDKSFTYKDNTDGTFFLPIQEGTTATYDDPSLTGAVNGYSSAANAARGANCANITPTGAPADTFGNWSAVDSTRTTGGYGICTLTYMLAFDDDAVVYCNSASEQAFARTVKDYLNTIVTDSAQNAAAAQDYSLMPSDILLKARNGVAAIDWAKTGGRPCSATPTPTATATPVATAPPGATPVPTPAPVSNVFTLPGKPRVSGTQIKLSAQLPGAGKLVVKATAKSGKKTITVASSTVTATASGSKAITLKIGSAAKSALKKANLKVTIKLTFTPTGGTAASKSSSLTVKKTKAAKKTTAKKK